MDTTQQTYDCLVAQAASRLANSGGPNSDMNTGGQRRSIIGKPKSARMQIDVPSNNQFDAKEGVSTSGDKDAPTVIAGIPAYNEEISIGSTVLTATEFADKVIVVDDGSNDRTSTIAEQAGALVLTHSTNQGKGASVKTLLQFTQQFEYHALVLLDADGQHDPIDIPSLVEPVINQDADIVVGSRYMGSGRRKETPIYRRFGQQFLDILTATSSGAKLSDSQSGFRVLSAKAVNALSLSTDGIGVETEMISDATEKNLDIVEIPIEARYEGVEESTHNPIHHGVMVLTLIFKLLRDKRPLLFFGIPGFLSILAGTLYGIDAILIYQSTGNFYPAKVLISGIILIIGVLSTFSALILNSISRTIKNTGGEK